MLTEFAHLSFLFSLAIQTSNYPVIYSLILLPFYEDYSAPGIISKESLSFGPAFWIVIYYTKIWFHTWSLCLIPWFSPTPASPPYQPSHRSPYLSCIRTYPFHKGSTNFSLYIVHLLLPNISYCFFTVYMAVRVKNWFYNLKGRIKSYKLINWTHIYWLPSMSQAQWDTANKTDKTPTRKVMI